MATASAQRLWTAEEFGDRPDPGYPEELVRGRILRMPPPRPRHGEICNRVGRFFGNFVEEHDLGRVLSNDSGVVTERGPDTVRGADVAYYSYRRVPKGPLPNQYLDVAPELIVEVLSPSNHGADIFANVTEYLRAGVSFVLRLDDKRRVAQLFDADGGIRTLGPEDDLTIPELLPGFRVKVARIFERIAGVANSP
jgi:Uma2 family endonuclease